MSFVRFSETRAFNGTQAASGIVELELPRESWGMRILLHMWGTFTVGAVNGANIRADSPLGLIQYWRLLLKGQEVASGSGPLSYHFARINQRLGGTHTLFTAPPNIGVYTIDEWIDLGPAFQSQYNELDHLVPLSATDQAVLQITCAPLTEAVALGAGTTLASALNLRAMVTMHPPNPNRPLTWKFATQYVGAPITAVANDFIYRIRQRDCKLSGILLRQLSGAAIASQTSVDTAITAVRVEAGGFDFVPWSDISELRESAMKETGITIPVGYIYLPFNLNGMASEMIDMDMVNGEVAVHMVHATPAATQNWEMMYGLVPKTAYGVMNTN